MEDTQTENWKETKVKVKSNGRPGDTFIYINDKLMDNIVAMNYKMGLDGLGVLSLDMLVDKDDIEFQLDQVKVSRLVMQVEPQENFYTE